MELTKKQLLWGILLFGTLVGLNETLIGGLHVQFKSVILSSITLMLLCVARYKIPKIGSSLLITLIAVLFKLTDLGIYLCKPVMVIMLGFGFEILATLFLSRNNIKPIRFILTCTLTSLGTFLVFALFERFVVGNEYWVVEKFNDYIFVKAPLTAFTSSIITLIALVAVKRLPLKFSHYLQWKPALSQTVLAFSILSLWIIGYVFK